MLIKEKPDEVLIKEIKRQLSEGRQVVMCVKGRSMLPFIRGGKDSVVLESAGFVKVGDVLLCEVGAGNYVLHRLIKKEKWVLVLMGDGNIRGVEYCEEKNVIACVSRIIRNGRSYACDGMLFRGFSALWRKALFMRRYLLYLFNKLQGFS